MNIIKTNMLKNSELLAIRELEALCKAYDNLTGSLFLSGELNLYEALPCFFLLYEDNELCAFLSIFVPSENEAEISVCTHPDKRKRGFATSLLCKAADLLLEYDIHDMIFPVEPDATTAAVSFLPMLKKFNAKLINSEYLMTYDNSDSAPFITGKDSPYKLVAADSPSGLDLMAFIHHRAFETDYAESETFIQELLMDNSVKAYTLYDKSSDQIAGCCFLDISPNRLIVLGVCIDPAMQGRGLGRLMITRLLEQCAADFRNIPVSLQVNGHNRAAKHLYESLGFKITSQFDYYIADCDNLW